MSYASLQVGVGFLKNFDALVSDAQKGLTAADVAKAEAYADRTINAFFARRGYDLTNAAFQTAPMIVEIAEMLGAARMIVFKFAINADADPGLSEKLESDAKRLMEEVAVSGLLDADGDPIWPATGRAICQVQNVED